MKTCHGMMPIAPILVASRPKSFRWRDVVSDWDDIAMTLELVRRMKVGWRMANADTPSTLTRHAEMLLLCARIGYSPHLG